MPIGSCAISAAPRLPAPPAAIHLISVIDISYGDGRCPAVRTFRELPPGFPTVGIFLAPSPSFRCLARGGGAIGWGAGRRWVDAGRCGGRKREIRRKGRGGWQGGGREAAERRQGGKMEKGGGGKRESFQNL